MYLNREISNEFSFRTDKKCTTFCDVSAFKKLKKDELSNPKQWGIYQTEICRAILQENNSVAAVETFEKRRVINSSRNESFLLYDTRNWNYLQKQEQD